MTSPRSRTGSARWSSVWAVSTSLVNNAGLGMRSVNPRFLTDPQPFWDVAPDAFRDLAATNLTGYFLVARGVVPHFLAAGHGRIVNITMNTATMTRAGFVPYGPARAGAEALSRIMAADLAGTGVTVNQLLPGGATKHRHDPGRRPRRAAPITVEPGCHGPHPSAGSAPPRPPTCTINASSPVSSRPRRPVTGLRGVRRRSRAVDRPANGCGRQGFAAKRRYLAAP